jgi:sigma-B regulation protein RsbQ
VVPASDRSADTVATLQPVGVATKYNVKIHGRDDGQPVLFAHGFGCDQNMWRWMTPAFEADYRVILFDYVGAGDSDVTAYDEERYSSLAGYAADVLEICRELDLSDVIFVGHSVSSMIGALAVIEEPDRFSKLVMVGPSPRYVDDEGYVGGFTHEDILELLDSLESNYLGWSHAMAPAIMANPDRPELSAELEASFCRTDPAIAGQFARVTFLSDNRADLARLRTPTLILQSAEDVIAPHVVGEFVHEAVPNSTLVTLNATGHCPHLSASDETTAAILSFLRT